MPRPRSRPAQRPSESEMAVVLGAGPFPAALRAAIRRRGLPLERLRDRLASQGVEVALSTLSSWQRGTYAPTGERSRVAVTALEPLLGVGPGTLTRLLRDPDPPAPSRPLTERTGPIGQLLDQVRGSRRRDLEVLSHHVVHTVDAQRRAVASRTRLVVRALEDGADRYVARIMDAPTVLGAQAWTPVARHGCRLGQVLRHPAAAAMVFELVFDVRLAAGDTWVFEWQTFDASPEECPEVSVGFRHPIGLLVLQVQFDPSAPPSACFAHTRNDYYEPSAHGGPLSLAPGGSVQLCLTGWSTGVAGVRWRW